MDLHQDPRGCRSNLDPWIGKSDFISNVHNLDQTGRVRECELRVIDREFREDDSLDLDLESGSRSSQAIDLDLTIDLESVSIDSGFSCSYLRDCWDGE